MRIAKGIGGGLLVLGVVITLTVFPSVRYVVCDWVALSEICGTRSIVSEAEVEEARGDFDEAFTAYASFYTSCVGPNCYTEAFTKLAALDEAYVRWKEVAFKGRDAGMVDGEVLDAFMRTFDAWSAVQREAWGGVKACLDGEVSQLKSCLRRLRPKHAEGLALLGELAKLERQFG